MPWRKERCGPGSGHDRRWSGRRLVFGLSRFSRGTLKPLKLHAVVEGMPQSVKAIGDDLEMFVFARGKSAISTAGLPSITTTNPTVLPGTALVINSFSPLTS